MKKVQGLVLMVLGFLAFSSAIAQNVNQAVFVIGDNNIIQLGAFVETTPGNVPVSIYYNQDNRTFYYTWYSASKGYHVLKAYDSYSYVKNEYWGAYYPDGYAYNAPKTTTSY
jgi:hypothetical protein